jgi:hypothetical protein
LAPVSVAAFAWAVGIAVLEAPLLDQGAHGGDQDLEVLGRFDVLEQLLELHEQLVQERQRASRGRRWSCASVPAGVRAE